MIKYVKETDKIYLLWNENKDSGKHSNIVEITSTTLDRSEVENGSLRWQKILIVYTRFRTDKAGDDDIESTIVGKGRIHHLV